MGVVILTLLSIAVGLYLVAAGYLLLIQDRMLYHPVPYEDMEGMLRDKSIRQVRYRTAQGAQTAFYFPPVDDPERAPDRLCLTFTGNAGRVLDWIELVDQFPDRRAGFLMMDYPGYGACEGKPSVPAIMESNDAAIAELADRLGTTPGQLEQHLSVVGHSMGAAMALEFARTHRVEHVVLISPFTSLRAMARIRVGPAFVWLLRHDLDNAARLSELSRLSPRPRVLIVHGQNDETVPVRMARDLAMIDTEMIEYVEIVDDHNAIVFNARERIWEMMMKQSPAN
ncbi:alpha/beta fold hydrolase [Candidatus Sumerlaeota bacterium]|nr:alpha/beta fold hydrolase [Candidatus Sumerlaeota bacterium]